MTKPNFAPPRPNFIPPYRYQDETNTWLASIGVANVSTRSAQHFDKLIRDCKEAGIWSLLDLIYPFIGNTISDATTGFRPKLGLQKLGTMTNFIGADYTEATGLTGDGSTKYFVANTAVSTIGASDNDIHMACYMRTDNAQAGNRILLGAADGTPHHFWVGSLTPASSVDCRLGQAVTATAAAAFTKGFYMANRVASNSLILYKNGASIGTSSSATTGVRPATTMSVGCYNNNGTQAGYVNTPIAFASFGNSMTAQQASDYYAIVQTFQTNLGRNF